ncbi:MAG: hypothetical protein FWD92_05750 [Methanomassiliicoccaceae archaeon]|nr:hypothetical protein [Methanomassiliicoccaceae archaeon]
MSVTKEQALSMLDITLREFEELYYVNEKLFRSVNNWFYFANDRKASSLASKGYVCYGRNRARKQAFGFPEDGHGGLFLRCDSEADIDVRAKCGNEKNGIVYFDLEDGTKAHYGILKDPIGLWGPEDAEYSSVIIPNKPQTKTWPYSTKGSTTFEKASKEEGTLPYYVLSGEIEKLIPARIKEDLGLSDR